MQVFWAKSNQKAVDFAQNNKVSGEIWSKSCRFRPKLKPPVRSGEMLQIKEYTCQELAGVDLVAHHYVGIAGGFVDKTHKQILYAIRMD